ncbi:MAG: hypothetical protein ACNI26_04050 [Terasakiella sp.]|uniref:hypothetical protein n=1 Tax=unclassified Terasakiella TaxID=2614952 RepID=UPI003AFFE596
MSDDTVEWPEFLKPRLRLFFGVDLVGSTSFKQKSKYPLKSPSDKNFGDLGASWFSEIANFYRSVEEHFKIAWDDCCISYARVLNKKLNCSPSLWKSNGDELIYSISLNEPDDVGYVLTAWLKALKAYRTELKERNQDLDIKGAAWIAGFPIDNAEVIFCKEISKQVERYRDEDPKVFHFELLEKWYHNDDEDNREGLVKDYVGPAIDTGFRVSTQATPRKFVLSLETALMLSGVTLRREFYDDFGVSRNILKMAFDGLKTFKGVLGGKPYPLFWIDFLHEDDELTKAFIKLSQTDYPNKDDILDYCEQFITDNSSQFFYPFIYEHNGNRFNQIPPNYIATLDRLTERWVAEKDRLDIRWQSMKEDISKAPPSNGNDDVVDVAQDITVPLVVDSKDASEG